MNKGNQLRTDELQRLLNKLPENEKKQKKLIVHLQLTNQLTDIINGESNFIMELVALEQAIISGVDDDFKPQTMTSLVKSVNHLVKKLRLTDSLRLMIIFLCTYKVKDADFKIM